MCGSVPHTVSSLFLIEKKACYVDGHASPEFTYSTLSQRKNSDKCRFIFKSDLVSWMGSIFLVILLPVVFSLICIFSSWVLLVSTFGEQKFNIWLRPGDYFSLFHFSILARKRDNSVVVMVCAVTRSSCTRDVFFRFFLFIYLLIHYFGCEKKVKRNSTANAVVRVGRACVSKYHRQLKKTALTHPHSMAGVSVVCGCEVRGGRRGETIYFFKKFQLKVHREAMHSLKK